MAALLGAAVRGGGFCDPAVLLAARLAEQGAGREGGVGLGARLGRSASAVTGTCPIFSAIRRYSTHASGIRGERHEGRLPGVFGAVWGWTVRGMSG